MNNLSYTKKEDIIDVIPEKEIIEIIDDRVIISEIIDEVGFFLISNGKPLVFKNQEKAEKYINKNKLINVEVEPITDYNFADIEIIEL